MDDTDRKLILVISENPRMRTRDIAKRLGISRQAVHHRMQILAGMGVFRSMRAQPSAHYLNAVLAAVWGRSNAMSVEETMDRLGENEFVGRVVVAGGNYFYVLGNLRDTSEIDGYVEFIKQTAKMPEPIVGMANMNAGIMPDWVDGGKRKQSYKELSPLDLKIIASLRDDARKPAAKIAESIGVSTKTVRRHLEAMRADGSLDFDTPWDVPSGEDMLTLVHVNLRGGADKVLVARRLLSEDPVHFMYLRTFINLPDFLLGLICSDKMSEIRKILKRIGDDEDVEGAIPNLVYLERAYPTWDDNPQSRTRAPRRYVARPRA